jgi:low affinity Fe/Cu permease
MVRHRKHGAKQGRRHQAAERGQRKSQGWRELFRHMSRGAAVAVGSAWAFMLAVLVVVVWALTGPLFHYSDTWQLVINTGTTVVTFLMVFLIQNTQNRDSREIHLKLDELLRAISHARTGLADLDDLSDRELDSLLEQFHHLRRERGMTAPEPGHDPPAGSAAGGDDEGGEAEPG